MIVLVFDESEYLIGKMNIMFPPPKSERVLFVDNGLSFVNGYLQLKSKGMFYFGCFKGLTLEKKLIDDDIYEEIINISNEYNEIMERMREHYQQSDFPNRLSKRAQKAIIRVFVFLEYKINQIINHQYNYRYEFKDENNNSRSKYNNKIISFQEIELKKKKDEYKLYIRGKRVKSFINIERIILMKAFDRHIYEMYIVSLILKNISDQILKFTDNLYEEFTLMDSGNTTKSARNA